jgi:hypothetical protein
MVEVFASVIVKRMIVATRPLQMQGEFFYRRLDVTPAAVGVSVCKYCHVDIVSPKNLRRTALQTVV